jgi:hypothetical protein
MIELMSTYHVNILLQMKIKARQETLLLKKLPKVNINDIVKIISY